MNSPSNPSGLTQLGGHAAQPASPDQAVLERVANPHPGTLYLARFTAPDPCAGLADAALMAKAKDMPELDLFHPWNIDVAQAIELARRCEDAAFAVSPKIGNSEGANTSIQQSHFVSANSHGFLGGYATTRHGLSCSVIAGEGDAMQREYWYDSRRDPAELMVAEEVGRRAGERALARLGAKKIRTCEVPVLFEAQLAVALVGNFVQAVSGGSLYRKSSFLLDSLGKQVFSPVVSIAEQIGRASCRERVSSPV